MWKIAILLLIPMISGCGFHGWYVEKENGIYWNASRPCSIKKGDIEIDGKGDPLLKFDIPLNKIGS
ncbi:MAG: hypothetical protein KKD77_24360 [Gammaproteobacteria bacterium]|nr:hypothetical protein [Gammaproteobacteria bacterium]